MLGTLEHPNALPRSAYAFYFHVLQDNTLAEALKIANVLQVRSRPTQHRC